MSFDSCSRRHDDMSDDSLVWTAFYHVYVEKVFPQTSEILLVHTIFFSM